MIHIKPTSNNGSKEARAEILDHMTRAEMIAELMVMLNEVKDKDMPLVCDLIQQVIKKDAHGQ